MNTSCAGKCGLVTGASDGLGRATVLSLAADGANVMAVSRSLEKLRHTAALAADLPGTVVIRQCDVSNQDEVEKAVAELEGLFSTVDFAVNNAGVLIERGFLETTAEDWDAIDRTNVRGTLGVCQRAITAMLRLGVAGSIVNIGSVLSAAADPLLAAYTASKHSVLGITRSIAASREIASAGIRANAVLPGDMETPMVQQYFAAHADPAAARQEIAAHYPIGRIADPAEVAGVVRFLISDESSFVNGAAITVDGGLGASLY